MALHEGNGLPVEAIRRVQVLVPREAVDIVCEPLANKRKPANNYEAQFSVPYIVATGLLKGRFTLAELEDEALPQLRRAGGRVAGRLRGRPCLNVPRHYTGEVVVETTDGRSLRHHQARQSRLRRSAADE